MPLEATKDEETNFECEELRKLVSNHSEGVYGFDNPECTEELDSSLNGQDANAQQENQLPWIFNGLDGFVETNEVMNKGLSEMGDAISMLPYDEKEALLEIRENIPELAAKEAPPLRYLRFENYNTWAAAQRLATYWKVRKQVFGERWQLPMDSTGEGTLTRDEVVLFSSGYLAILPYDKRGRSVVCYDPSRRSEHSLEMRNRVGFYLWSVVAENPISQQEGAKCLIVQRTTKSDPDAQKAMFVVFESLPIRYESVHIMNCPYDFEKTTFLESLVPIMLRCLGVVAKRCTVHVASTKEELVEKLSKFDILPEGIPECLGGSWSYDLFSHWIELRTRYEWNLPWSGEKMPFLPHIPAFTAKPRSKLTDAEKVERERRLNVMNSRRKRVRVKVEAGVLSEQVTQLKKQNLKLQMESKRLEECLAAAKAEASKVEMTHVHLPSLSVGIDQLSGSGFGLSQVPVALPTIHSPRIGPINQRDLLEKILRDQARNALLQPPGSFPRRDQLPVSGQHVLGRTVVTRPMTGIEQGLLSGQDALSGAKRPAKEHQPDVRQPPPRF